MARHEKNNPGERDTHDTTRGIHDAATLAVPRSRGALSGIVLTALGAWGAMLPLLGPHFHFGYGPDNKTFDVTAPRFWLQILPGVVTAVAGILILLGGNRVTGTFWGCAAAAAGAWYVVGPIPADLRQRGYVATPIGSNDRQHLDAIAAFYGLGAVILFFAALTIGRLSVVGIRDVETKNKRHHKDQATADTAGPTAREVPATITHVRPVNRPDTRVLPEPGATREPVTRER